MKNTMKISDKKLLATITLLLCFAFLLPLANAQQGPKMDVMRLRVIQSPDAVRTAVITRVVDFAPDLIRTSDIEEFAGLGKIITYRPGFHWGEIGWNLRQPLTGDVNFRHAVQHCFPRDDLIGTIYKYIVTKVNTVVPPALSEWYWPNVWAHDFAPGDPVTSPAWDGIKDSPTETACGVLKYGGYTYNATEGYWQMPGTLDPMPHVDLFSPLSTVAPTSATSAARLVTECNNIGLSNIAHLPYDFAGYISLVRDEHDFDGYMIFHGISPRPTYLYYMLHSSQDVLGGDNWPGVQDPELYDLL
jgi:ABC-type transport system substrate-binding protein